MSFVHLLCVIIYNKYIYCKCYQIKMFTLEGNTVDTKNAHCLCLRYNNHIFLHVFVLCTCIHVFVCTCACVSASMHVVCHVYLCVCACVICCVYMHSVFSAHVCVYLWCAHESMHHSRACLPMLYKHLQVYDFKFA